MSRFSGPQGKGAMRTHRETLRAEAIERQGDFNRDVARIMVEQDVSAKEARRIAAASRRVRRGVRALERGFRATSSAAGNASIALAGIPEED